MSTRAPSLRNRLVMIPTLILFAGLAATLLFIVGGARARVQAEVQSGMRLGALLVQDALRSAAESPDPAAALARFAADLPQVRHVRFSVEPAPAIASNAAAAPEPPAAPVWFSRLLAPRTQVARFPVALPGTPPATVVMRTTPGDEIGEIWNEVLLLGALLIVVWLAMVALITLTVRAALRPLRRLAAAFDALEHGRHTPLPPIGVAELRRIGTQFNALAAALARAGADNRLLIERLMSLQEAERSEVAHELHDEIGPALFGIRADAACIQRFARDPADRRADIAERAAAASRLADVVQRTVHRMLDRLRPLVLDEMGLLPALRDLHAAWAARLPAIGWTLDLPDDLPPTDAPRALALYRAAQECLTNAARHARPARVVLALRAEADGTLRLAVGDDGAGIAPGQRHGFGLLGMAERVHRLHGTLDLRPRPGGGTDVTVRLPPPHGSPIDASPIAEAA